MEPAIGIDLGTTNSCMGVWRNDWVEIIPNDRGNKTTPSRVSFTDMRRYFGETAVDQSITNSCNTIFDVKRLIGTRFTCQNNDMKLLPFKLADGQGDRTMISVQYKDEEKQFSTLEISSMIIRKMRETAEAFLRCPIKNAVISVPACFNESQRLATMDAATVAGLNVMCIINEPTAAAIAYGFNHMNDGVAEKNVLIFDLGGGTLDVSVLAMDLKRGNYVVKATGGDAHLGGVDFDNNLIKHCIDELNREHGKELKLDSKALGKLRSKCEETKIMLSSVAEVDIQIDPLLKGIDFYSLITRSKFEELNKDLFERCIEIVDDCLRAANMYRSSIHDVVLIGGSTRIPKMKQLLRDFFDGKNLSMGINSNEAVACGATIQAAILSANSKVRDLKVHEISNYSLGIDKDGEFFKMPRNIAIPAAWNMILNVEEKDITISVYEGESTRINDNNLLGLWTLKPVYFPHYDVGNQFPVLFNIDENGVFSISAHENNMVMQIPSDSRSKLSREEIDKMAADAENLKLEEDRYKKKVEAKNALEALVDHLRRSIENTQSERGHEKLLIEIRQTTKWMENNAQAVGDGFDQEYKWHVSQLNKALRPTGVMSRLFSSTSTVVMINSDMEFASIVSEFSGVNLSGTSKLLPQHYLPLELFPTNAAGHPSSFHDAKQSSAREAEKDIKNPFLKTRAEKSYGLGRSASF